MRGDRPRDASKCQRQQLFTPHARGSTACKDFERRTSMVYPACAGIDLSSSQYANVSCSLPRMRGDRPFVFQVCQCVVKFTPHARGSTVITCSTYHSCVVYPACAGIDLSSLSAQLELNCLPRMRGDRPFLANQSLWMFLFTPHARGSTSRSCLTPSERQVYPACAGIDRDTDSIAEYLTRLPRMRGDRP